MHVTLATSGGFAYLPALAEPVSIESEKLPPQTSSKLETLTKAADFFELPHVVGRPQRGAADYQHHTLTIDDGNRRNTVQITEPIRDANLQALVEMVQEIADETE